MNRWLNVVFSAKIQRSSDLVKCQYAGMPNNKRLCLISDKERYKYTMIFAQKQIKRMQDFPEKYKDLLALPK